MNETPTVVMNFKPGRPVRIEVNGVQGQACRGLSEPFQRAIGGSVVSDTPKAEMTAMSAVTVGGATTAKLGG